MTAISVEIEWAAKKGIVDEEVARMQVKHSLNFEEILDVVFEDKRYALPYFIELWHDPDYKMGEFEVALAEKIYGNG